MITKSDTDHVVNCTYIIVCVCMYITEVEEVCKMTSRANVSLYTYAI